MLGCRLAPAAGGRAGKLAAGVAMVLAFSVGMAIVLVLVGLVAWKLKSAALGCSPKTAGAAR